MRQNSKSVVMFRWLPAGAGVMLALSANTASAIDDRIIGTFDTDIQVANQSNLGWPAGSSTQTLEWSSEDAGGDSGSGSLKVIVDFNGTAPNWNDSKVNFGDAGVNDFAWPGIDCRPYLNVEWDVKVDVANSHPAGGGNYGTYGAVQVVCQGWEGANGNPAGLNWKALGTPMVVTNLSGWQHMTQPLTDYPYNLNRLVLNLIVQSGTNRITYLLDNVKLTAPAAPPPTILPMEKATPGLAFVAASPSQWDRQNIRTRGTNYSWIGRPGPVSYSVDIAKHAPGQNFRLHMYLVPGISNPNRFDSDWHEPNCLLVQIQSQADGAAWGQINCKVNAPNANGRQFEDAATGGGNLGGIGSTSSAGTWSLTLSDDGNLLLRTPDGTELTNTIPAAIMDVWRTYPELQFAVGIMPGNLDYIGQMAIVNGVKITGAAAPDIDDSFLTGSLDTNTWQVAAASPTYGVQQIPTDAAYWMKWALPDTGFSLQTSPTLDPGAWTSIAASGFSAGDIRHTLIRQGDLPGGNSGFFRLVKRGYSKLLLLLPGETAAPGTPTGKTGTPEAQQVGYPFDLTVRAVDSEWFPISGVDNSIRLTSTDSSAVVDYFYLPLDTALLNGAYAPASGSSFFGAQGTWTITVEDITDPAKASYMSAPVVVNP